MLLNTTPTLRHATQADWPAIEALLVANKLPTDGAQAHLNTYLLAISNGEVVGSAGAEVYGQIALLRSVAVAPGLHKQGIGKLLLGSLLQEARRRDIGTLYLLTVTAPEYFAQYGFKRGKIEDAPHALKASAELQGACPACAAFMSLTLQEAPRRNEALPVAVLGAGPVGLAAAAELLERSIPFVILEAGQRVGANLLDYGHVRLFSPWQYNVDAAMAKHLSRSGWQAPPPAELPLAGEVAERVLQPFAALPEVANALKLDTKVVSVSREGFDKVKSAGRSEAPFVIRAMQAGQTIELRARVVIDATGTWGTPNPVGASGLQAIGEAEAARCRQWHPDDRQRHAAAGAIRDQGLRSTARDADGPGAVGAGVLALAVRAVSRSLGRGGSVGVRRSRVTGIWRAVRDAQAVRQAGALRKSGHPFDSVVNHEHPSRHSRRHRGHRGHPCCLGSSVRMRVVPASFTSDQFH